MGILAMATAHFAPFGFASIGRALVARVFSKSVLGQKFNVCGGLGVGDFSSCQSTAD